MVNIVLQDAIDEPGKKGKVLERIFYEYFFSFFVFKCIVGKTHINS